MMTTGPVLTGPYHSTYRVTKLPLGCEIEALELRRLFTISFGPGTITVNGDDVADSISIKVDGGQYVVNEDGLVRVAPVGEITSITVHGNGGTDDVLIWPNVTLGVNIYGGDQRDTLQGGAGGDFIWGGAGEDVISGENGDDTLRGEGNSDTIHGRVGADVLEGGDAADTLVGGSEVDNLRGGTGEDWIYGDDDAFFVFVARNDARDYCYGDGGQDTIYGDTPGASTVEGSTGGNDFIFGGSESDTLHGGMGNDEIKGEDGHDELQGDDGADTLWGDAGIDGLYGGKGNDLLHANDGVFGEAVYGGDDWDTAHYDWSPTDNTQRDSVGDDVEDPPPSERQG